MKTLSELTIALQDNASRSANARKSYEAEMGELTRERTEILTLRSLLLSELSIDLVATAESILDISGDISNRCEGQVIAELAANDIANGCKHLSKEYYGNKTYSAYYQRNDCTYGYGPKHGSIVESVGLRYDFRGKSMTEFQKDACIYYLLNFKKIQAAKKAALQDPK